MTGPASPHHAPSHTGPARPDVAASTVVGVADIPAPRARGDDDVPRSRPDAPAGLRIDIARAAPAVSLISLAGAVTVTTAQAFATAMAGAVSASAGGRVVLELNRVTFLDSCGIGVLLAAHGDASRRGVTVVLVVDDVAPAAVPLWCLAPGRGPHIHPTLTAALTAADPT